MLQSAEVLFGDCCSLTLFLIVTLLISSIGPRPLFIFPPPRVAIVVLTENVIGGPPSLPAACESDPRQPSLCRNAVNLITLMAKHRFLKSFQNHSGPPAESLLQKCMNVVVVQQNQTICAFLCGGFGGRSLSRIFCNTFTGTDWNVRFQTVTPWVDAKLYLQYSQLDVSASSQFKGPVCKMVTVVIAPVYWLVYCS